MGVVGPDGSSEGEWCWRLVNSVRHAMVSFVLCKCGSTEELDKFPLMDGKEHGLLKECMAAIKMKAEQEFGIGPKAQESGSLCDVFLLFRDYTE